MIKVFENKKKGTPDGWILPGGHVTTDIELAETVQRILDKVYKDNQVYITQCQLDFLRASEEYKGRENG